MEKTDEEWLIILWTGKMTCKEGEGLTQAELIEYCKQTWPG